tara:strand:- start:734 stop:880 length:147 start_codon:yes stop_codon:yes gene_type:complete
MICLRKFYITARQTVLVAKVAWAVQENLRDFDGHLLEATPEGQHRPKK